MNLNLFNKLPFVLCLLFATAFVISSCGEDDVPAGEAANLKFIGDYVGEVTCAGALAAVINDPALSFNISNTSPATDNTVQVNLPSLPIPLELTGTVSGNNVDMDETTVDGVMVPFNGINITVNVTANGDAKLVGNALTANIFLSSTGDISTTDECTIIANKQ